ncbi:peptidoglycan-binding protein [Isoptericola sp. NPDC056578]|uniref:peptidoglycan-binding domain-containing protein n=1 Tax=Isoptericola sp. NPDC056578 TaxID=3345870 RepID=UPI0036782DA6
MTKRSRLLVALVSLLTILGGGLAAAVPASAATAYCNTMKHRSATGTYVPYSSSAGTYTCYMNATNKTRGDGVVQLQASMNYCFGQSIAADGVFGNNTRDALVAVQKKIGVTADGRYGPETRNKMKWVSLGNGGSNDHCFAY